MIASRRLAPSLARRLTPASNGLRTTTAPTPATSVASRVKSTVVTPATGSRLPFAAGLGGGLVLAGLHSATGSANDFYDYRFKSPKNPDDLASFYGGEELMELFCIFPIVGQIMMRNARFDDTGNVITTGFPGQMKVSMVFSDEENESTGETDWFNKRERFRNTLFGYTCWDMVLNFGFRTLEDGTRECYHFGEYFHGNMPILSQVMLLVFKVHARWVVWSTEHHVNHFAFSINADCEDEDEEEKLEKYEHDSRANMPFFLLRNYAWSDLMAMITGKYNNEKQPSFLITEGSSHEDDEDEDEDNKLPFQRKDVQIQISKDIMEDKRVMKELLAGHHEGEADDVKDVLVKRSTLARRRTLAMKKGGGIHAKHAPISDEDLEGAGEESGGEGAPKPTQDVYVMAKDLAVDRAQMRRVTKRRNLTTGQEHW